MSHVWLLFCELKYTIFCGKWTKWCCHEDTTRSGHKYNWPHGIAHQSSTSQVNTNLVTLFFHDCPLDSNNLSAKLSNDDKLISRRRTTNERRKNENTTSKENYVHLLRSGSRFFFLINLLRINWFDRRSIGVRRMLARTTTRIQLWAHERSFVFPTNTFEWMRWECLTLCDIASNRWW